MGILLSIFLASFTCFGAVKSVSKEVAQNPYYQYYKIKATAIALSVVRQEAVLSYAKEKFEQNADLHQKAGVSQIELKHSESEYLASKATLEILKQKVLESEARLDIVVHRIQNNLEIPFDTD